MAEVVLENVFKVYPDGYEAVKGFNLNIADREFVVFVGPSGCGKSTTLRMIAGLEDITSGTLKIGERVSNHVPPKDRDIAMVFQNYALYPHMTVFENMAFGLKLRRTARDVIGKKVGDAARMLGLESMLERKPKALSGGQRQRVAVGRALVRDPKCFLFDEPLSNLDARLRVQMRAEIKKLQSQLAATTIYVTHDQEEAMTLGDRVVVMKDGLIQQCDTPLAIYRRPANRFVAGFLGTPPMNFIDGLVVEDASALWFDEGGFRVRVPGPMVESLRPYLGRKVVLGVRPQAFSIARATDAMPAGTALNAKVSLVEPLGDRTDIRFVCGRQDDLVAQLQGDADVAAGRMVTLRIDLDRVHVFEAEGEGRRVGV
jgi:multiple sugar transport system ATP-binding protein